MTSTMQGPLAGRWVRARTAARLAAAFWIVVAGTASALDLASVSDREAQQLTAVVPESTPDMVLTGYRTVPAASAGAAATASAPAGRSHLRVVEATSAAPAWQRDVGPGAWVLAGLALLLWGVRRHLRR